MALSIGQEAAARFVEQRVAGDAALYKPKQDITILIEKPRRVGLPEAVFELSGSSMQATRGSLKVLSLVQA